MYKLRFLSLIPLCLACFFSPLVAKEAKETKEAPSGYTINFDNVSIKEFLRFVSKIAGINIIYNEVDLDFDVTIISEDETDLDNIMSALVQILRIHGLTLIEEQQNLLIHRNDNVRQIPTVVSNEHPLKGKFKPAIMTKVFKIYRGDPSHIASLITPMLSGDALVEVSMETRQLIITDVTTSIETIEALLLSLDTPNTPYDVDTYIAKNLSPEDLASLAGKIIKPISDNATLELIPQPITGTVYIVSTPFLIERAIAVLKDLDKEPMGMSGVKKLATDNVLIYKLQFRSPKDIEQSLSAIAKSAEGLGFTSEDLETTIKGMKYVKSMNSLMFIGSPNDLSVVQAFLKSIDAAEMGFGFGPPSFFLFEPVGMSLAEAKGMMADIVTHLKKTEYAHPGLITALENAQIIGPPINAILFTGGTEAVGDVKTLLTSIEHSYETETKRLGPSKFVLYNIKVANEEQIRQSLNHLADYLEANHYPNRDLIDAIDSMRWVKATNSLMFTGHSKALQELLEILPTFDVPPDRSKTALSQVPLSSEFILYTPVNTSTQHIKDVIADMTKNLKSADLADPLFLKTLESARVLPATQQILFTGDSVSLARLQKVLEEIDIATQQQARIASNTQVIFIHLANQSATYIVSLLHETAAKLTETHAGSVGLIASLKNSQAMANAQTVIITGAPEDIEKVKEFIAANDIPTNFGKESEVFVYKLKYMSFDELKEALGGIASHAQSQNPNDETTQLSRTIQTMRPIPDSNAVQFVGTVKIVAKLQDLLTILDTPEHGKNALAGLSSNFLVYTVKNAKPQTLLADLKQLVADSPNLAEDKTLLKTVRTGRYAPDSHALVFTGNRQDLDKIQSVLQKLDVSEQPQQSTNPNRKAEGYKIYKPMYVPGPELIQMAKNFEQHLLASGVMDHDLAETIDHLSYVNRSNMIIVTGQEKEVAEVMKLLHEFDEYGSASGRVNGLEGDVEQIEDMGFLIYKLQYQPGQSIVNALSVISADLAGQKTQKKNEALIEAIQSVQWIDITNSLIASGEPKILQKLKELIASIDRPLKQVFIEILVLETTISDQLNFGLRWGSQGVVSDKFSWATGNYPPAAVDNSTFADGLKAVTGTVAPTGTSIQPLSDGFLGVIGDLIWHKGKSYASLGSLLDALKTDSDATVVLSQKIIVQDNQNAKIFSGENIPFTGSLVTTAGLSQTTNANLEYRNIGVTVSLTPIIGDSGVITLDIDHEISEEENSGTTSSNVSSNNLNGIRTTKTSMLTRVHMPDRHFLILSGTMRNQVLRSTSGLPCLGGLPLIGAAFTSTTKSTVNRNVVMFVKPHIVESPDIYGEITKNQEEIFGSKDQSNPEDFYKGLELIRSPDDVDVGNDY